MKANKPGLQRTLFEVDCKIPRSKILDIDWIGNSVIMIWVDEAYANTFKRLSAEGGMKIDGLEGGDPLSPNFFKKPVEEDKQVSTSKMVKEACRKYAARLQKRLGTVRVDCLRRTLKE